MKMMITTYSKRILRCEPTAGYTQLAHAAVSFQTISPFKGIRRNAFSLVLTSWKIEFSVPLNSSHKTCSLI